MDPSVFDTPMQPRVKGKTRRRILTLLAALPLVDALATARNEASAEKPHERLRRRTKQRNRKQRNRKQRQHTSSGGGHLGDSGTCTSQCAGKVCGPDGCGGSCGTCGANSICHDGACQPCDICPTCRYHDLNAAVGQDSALTLYICPGEYDASTTIERDCTVIGAGQGNDPTLDTILVGAGTDLPVISIYGDHNVTLQGLRIKLASIVPGNGALASGGGVFTRAKSLTMIDCTVTENAGNGTAGIQSENPHGKLVLTGCTISNNTNAPGYNPNDNIDDFRPGGLYTRADSTLTNCVISGNVTRTGPTGEAEGGGILFDGGTHTLDNTIVTGNTAWGPGGGIYNQGATVILQNGSSVTGNIAKTNGGGIYNAHGTVTLQKGTTVSGNTPNNCDGQPVAGCKG